MSDFLLTTTATPPDRLRAALARFGGNEAARIEVVQGPWGTLAVALRGSEEAVVWEGGVATVLIGDAVVTAGGAPPALTWAPGRRLALHRAAAAAPPERLPDLLDGSFSFVVVDERGASGADGRGGMRGPAGGDRATRDARPNIRIVTDRMGFVPTYEAPGWWGTHPDALALAASLDGDLDPVSAADFLRHLSIAYPWTLYRGVLQMAPGTVHVVGGPPAPGAPTSGEAGTGRLESAPHTYWLPEEGDAFRGIGEAVEALRAAIEESVAAASRDLDRVGVLLSGGEDSRAVLAAIPPGRAVLAVSFADWESREVRIARRVAARHGAGFEVGLRAPAQYADGFPATAALTGSGTLFADLHSYGLHRGLALAKLPVVLGGFSADVLLKAFYAKTGRRPEERPGWGPDPLREDLVRAARERRDAHLEGLRRLRPRSADEWTILWPFSMRRASGHFAGNRRLFPAWEVFHAGAVLDVATRVPQEWKRNRRLFLRAVRPLLARTRWVPHASVPRFPGLPRPVSAALALPLQVARWGAGLATAERRSHGPWPSMSALAETLAARSRERAGARPAGAAPDPAHAYAFLPERGHPLRELFAGESGETERRIGEWHPFRRLALLQLRVITTPR